MEQQKENQFYVLFKLDLTEYVIPIDLVNEVIPITQVTPVPNELPFILGVINLRGKVIPIIDLGLKMKINVINKNYQHFLIVGSVNAPVGLRVNKVVDVMPISKNDIRSVDSKMQTNSKFLIGKAYLTQEKSTAKENIGKILEEIRKNNSKQTIEGKRVVYILNVDSVIYEEDRVDEKTNSLSVNL